MDHSKLTDATLEHLYKTVCKASNVAFKDYIRALCRGNKASIERRQDWLCTCLELAEELEAERKKRNENRNEHDQQ